MGFRQRDTEPFKPNPNDSSMEDGGVETVLLEKLMSCHGLGDIVILLIQMFFIIL